MIALFAIIALLTAGSPEVAIPSEAPQAVVEHVYPNGLKLLVSEDHKSPLAIFQIWYRVGAVDEPAGKQGVSHLLEHMMFKGTPHHASKELSRVVQIQGGSDNAFTSQDYTAYFQILPSDKLDISMEFEADRMRNLIMDPKETLAERDVVLEERRMRTEDDPQGSLIELLDSAAYDVHPYGHPVIGWNSTLQNITPEDLKAHYRKYYCPDNAVVVVVGDVDTEDIKKRVADRFGSLAACGGGFDRPAAQEPEQRGLRRISLKREAELPFVVSTYHTPRFPDREAYALELLAEILSGGKSGRLYKHLVYEQKLAQDVFADYSGLSRYPGQFYIGATATPGTTPDKLEAALEAEIHTIAKHPPTEREMEKALNGLLAHYVMGQDSIYYQALLLGTAEMAGDWRLRDSYPEALKAVKAEDVSRAAAKYLTEDNRTAGVLIPTNKTEKADK